MQSAGLNSPARVKASGRKASYNKANLQKNILDLKNKFNKISICSIGYFHPRLAFKREAAFIFKHDLNVLYYFCVYIVFLVVVKVLLAAAFTSKFILLFLAGFFSFTTFIFWNFCIFLSFVAVWFNADFYLLFRSIGQLWHRSLDLHRNPDWVTGDTTPSFWQLLTQPTLHFIP